MNLDRLMIQLDEWHKHLAIIWERAKTRENDHA